MHTHLPEVLRGRLALCCCMLWDAGAAPWAWTMSAGTAPCLTKNQDTVFCCFLISIFVPKLHLVLTRKQKQTGRGLEKLVTCGLHSVIEKALLLGCTRVSMYL